MMGDVPPCAPPTPPALTSFFFHLYFSTRLFLRSNTRLRPQTPTPSETAELSTNLTAWSDVSRSRITTNYEPSPALSLCPPDTILPYLSSAPQTPLQQQSTELCSHFFSPSISTFSDSASTVGNINWRECGERRGKTGEQLNLSNNPSFPAEKKKMIKIGGVTIDSFHCRGLKCNTLSLIKYFATSKLVICGGNVSSPIPSLLRFCLSSS